VQLDRDFDLAFGLKYFNSFVHEYNRRHQRRSRCVSISTVLYSETLLEPNAGGFLKGKARALQHQSTGANAPQNQYSPGIGSLGNASGPGVTQHQSTSKLNELRGPSSGSGNGGSAANISHVRHDFANQNQHLGLQQTVSQPQELQAVHGLPRPGSSPPSSV
jgi:hypothetical protein